MLLHLISPLPHFFFNHVRLIILRSISTHASHSVRLLGASVDSSYQIQNIWWDCYNLLKLKNLGFSFLLSGFGLTCFVFIRFFSSLLFFCRNWFAFTRSPEATIHSPTWIQSFVYARTLPNLISLCPVSSSKPFLFLWVTQNPRLLNIFL